MGEGKQRGDLLYSLARFALPLLPSLGAAKKQGLQPLLFPCLLFYSFYDFIFPCLLFSSIALLARRYKSKGGQRGQIGQRGKGRTASFALGKKQGKQGNLFVLFLGCAARFAKARGLQRQEAREAIVLSLIIKI
jgi:hypothetical protein